MGVRANNFFSGLTKKSDVLSDNSFKTTTAKRVTLIPPDGVRIYDTDLDRSFIGDGVTYGGIKEGARRSVNTITAIAASAFTVADTFKTIASAADGVFTSVKHGFVVGTKIIPMAADVTYGLAIDTVYTVTEITDDTFVLDGVVPETQTKDVDVKLFSEENNNYITWAQAATLRTGDSVTVAAGGGTIPSGLTAGAYFVLKNDGEFTAGGAVMNTDTKIKLASSRANALAGTAIVIRSVGAVGFTLVTTTAYVQPIHDLIVVNSAVDMSVMLPTAVGSVGRVFTVNSVAAGTVTVNSVAGTVDAVAAATGRVLKASSNDFITVCNDGANWVCTAKQITPP